MLRAMIERWPLSQDVSGALAPAGRTNANGPVIVPGVDSIDVSLASMEFLSLNHSAFAEKSDLIGDIRKLLSEDRRPPDARLRRYHKLANINLDPYWRYLPDGPNS